MLNWSSLPMSLCSVCVCVCVCVLCAMIIQNVIDWQICFRSSTKFTFLQYSYASQNISIRFWVIDNISVNDRNVTERRFFTELCWSSITRIPWHSQLASHSYTQSVWERETCTHANSTYTHKIIHICGCRTLCYGHAWTYIHTKTRTQWWEFCLL